MRFLSPVMRAFLIMICTGTLLPVSAKAICQDYFSYEWNEPLDMNGSADGPLSNVPNMELRDVTSFSYSNGVVSFNSTGNFPQLTFLGFLPYTPSINQNGAIPVGSRYGEAHPIQSSAYRYFVIRMYSSANTTARLQWGMNATRFAVADFAVSAGWNTYEINMNSLTANPIAGSNLNWGAGNWQGLQLYPGLASGISFQIDYVRLFTDSGCAGVSAPTVTFLQPDIRGGRDFAQTVLGNSWNMNGIGDIARIGNYSSANFYPNNSFTDSAGNLATGDYFKMENKTGNGDPAITLLSTAPAEKRIDTAEYKILCFGANNKTESGGYNSVTRVIYHDPSLPDAQAYRVGDDIVMARGLHDYCMDLSSVIDARTEPNQPSGSPSPWTAISNHGVKADDFRIDLNEVSEGAFFSHLDYVHLRTDHQANSQYGIAVNGPVTDAIDLYYSPEGGGAESYIGRLPVARSSNLFAWDTTAVPNGKYRVTSRVTRGGNTFFQKAPARIEVNHSKTQDQTPPILVCERPGNGYEYDSNLEIAGFALDETRLGVVELVIDGIYMKSFKPDRFHLAARDGYPAYADSNRAGFQQILDVSALGYGTHTVVLRAFDTAGNESSCSNSVTSRPGASTAPLVYPPNNASPISFTEPPGGNGGGGSGRPSIKVAYLPKSRSKITYTIKGTAACSAVTLQAGKDSKLSGAVTILSNATGAPIVASSSSVPGFAPSRRSKDDGVLFLQASCAGGTQSRVVKFQPSKAKSRKRVKSEAKILSHLSTHTQLGG